MFSAVLSAIDELSSLRDSSLLLSLLLGTFPGLSRAVSLRVVNAVCAFVVSTSRSV